MVVVEPFGGIGNRLRVVASGLALGAKLQRTVQIWWRLNGDLNCRFYDLFELDAPSVSIREFDWSRVEDRWRYRIADMIARVRHRYFDNDDVYRRVMQPGDFSHEGGSVLHFKTCHPFCGARDPYAALSPARTLYQTIRLYRRTNQIGVHVRRTDNREARLRSPTRVFIREMKFAIQENPEALFFVATDSPEEARRLRDNFPGRVSEHPKRSLDRHTKEAALDAVIDLFALAQCNRLIASYWSSFADVAAEIGKIEKIVARDEAV